MDCEKFDLCVMDALYDELDELTHAALKRHVEGCSRCRGILTGLRATREVGMLPLVEPSEDFEARVLDAVAVAQRRTPWPRKILRGLAWAGSHAMRPQLAMAALFFLVIGSSLLLLRAKPGTVGVAPVRVTERGAPALEAEPPAAVAVATPPPEAAPAATAAPTSAAIALADVAKSPYDDDGKREKVEATKPGAKADKDSAKLALDEANAVRGSSGCAAAVSKYDEVGARFPGTAAAADAMWGAAACYKSMGEAAKARELYLALTSTGYRDRAQRELDDVDANALGSNSNMGSQVASRAAARAGKAAAGPMPPAAAAAPAPAAPPAVSPNEAMAAEAPKAKAGGSPGKANAAPKKSAIDAAAGF